MRVGKVIALVILCVFAASLVVQAGSNKFGVSDNRDIIFTGPTRVGDVLLPMGECKVIHTMEGENHIMVFKQVNTKATPAQARAKCTLVPLTAKAGQTQQIYGRNDANERVLHELVFRGDTAKHLF